MDLSSYELHSIEEAAEHDGSLTKWDDYPYGEYPIST